MKEAVEHMNEIIRKSIDEFGDVMFQVASRANFLIKNRVINTGINAEGQPFEGYSTRPMLMNCASQYVSTSVCNRLAGSKKKRSELNWVTLKKGDRNIRLFELEGGYKQFRELHGRQTGHVDFMWSGEMWSSVQVVSDDAQHRKGRAIISTTRDEENIKLAGLTDMKGDILMLSNDEINEVSDMIENWLVEKWDEQ